MHVKLFFVSLIEEGMVFAENVHKCQSPVTVLTYSSYCCVMSPLTIMIHNMVSFERLN